MVQFNENNNFIYLALALLVLLVVTALAPVMPAGFPYWAVKIITAGTVFVSYLSLNFGAVWRKFNIALLLILLTTSILRGLFNIPPVPLFDLSVTLVFFLAVTWSAARRVLLSGEVDRNTIVGAIAVYLLLGLIWSLFYLIVLELSPTAFNGMEHMGWEDNFPKATYFSYVTLTTLGYGDISPAEPVSRVLTFLEAMVGTFYMAIVVASLIGSRVGKNSKFK